MPRRYNTDHQHAVLDLDTSVAPGAPHEFTDEQLEAGLTGSWSEENPRAGLEDEQEFKRLRDAKRPDLDEELRSLGIDPSELPNKQAAIDAIKAAKSQPSPETDTPEDDSSDTTDPAEPGEEE